eukprot:SAG25_NODE_5173_length_693_cov_0.754209_2_plen_99_part_01
MKHVDDGVGCVGVRLVDIGIVAHATDGVAERVVPEGEERVVLPRPIWHGLVVDRMPWGGKWSVERACLSVERALTCGWIVYGVLERAVRLAVRAGAARR